MVSAQKIQTLAARAITQAQCVSADPRVLAAAALQAALDEILADAFGGEAYQIYKLRNVDHLKIVYDMSTMMELAGGKWAEILQDMRMEAKVRPKAIRSVEDLAMPILAPQENRPVDPPIEPAGQSC